MRVWLILFVLFALPALAQTPTPSTPTPATPTPGPPPEPDTYYGCFGRDTKFNQTGCTTNCLFEIWLKPRPKLGCTTLVTSDSVAFRRFRERTPTRATEMKALIKTLAEIHGIKSRWIRKRMDRYMGD